MVYGPTEYPMAQQIDKRDVTRSEADRILLIEESHYIDLKAVESDPAGLSEAVSAFSNTAGGELFVGIDEKISKMLKLQMIALRPSKECPH
jgi:predicted HTH transcriptional regulator